MANLNYPEGQNMAEIHHQNNISSVNATPGAPPIALLLDHMQDAVGQLNEELDALCRKLGPVLSQLLSDTETTPGTNESVGTSEVAQQMEDQIRWVRRLTIQVNVIKNSLEI